MAGFVGRWNHDSTPVEGVDRSGIRLLLDLGPKHAA
jgi:hypothetical protein